MTSADDDELKNLIESNARAIAALADSLAELRVSHFAFIPPGVQTPG